ncbi:MAG TPA: ATP-binding protein [Candidatus Acidoferrales bacterium]
MSPRQKVRLIFSTALVLLALSGIAATVSIVNLVRSTKWVAHSYDVKQSIARVESLLSNSGRLRAVFISSRDASLRDQFDATTASVAPEMHHLKELTNDNPVQQAHCEQLEQLATERVDVLTASVKKFATGQSDSTDEAAFSGANLKLAGDTTHVLTDMKSDEDTLLQLRVQKSDRLLKLSVASLILMFLASIVLIAVHYRMLMVELGKREESETSARHLSAQLLRLQDEERRRFSRELHDGLGQTLAVLKWTLSSLLEKNPEDPTIAESVKSVDEAVLGTRTISHLLHPPLLDEAGFDSAARWYVEGFSQRSGIPVTITIGEVGRLPRSVELALFRVLQESLTNIHRHSKSPRAEVSLSADKKNVTLRVQDYGNGIPEETLENFLSKGTRVGVGLAGMRERVREQGGQFEIRSSPQGTLIEVTLSRTAPAGIENEFTDTSLA